MKTKNPISSALPVFKTQVLYGFIYLKHLQNHTCSTHLNLHNMKNIVTHVPSDHHAFQVSCAPGVGFWQCQSNSCTPSRIPHAPPSRWHPERMRDTLGEAYNRSGRRVKFLRAWLQYRTTPRREYSQFL